MLEASESTRLRMGESLPNHHEDHIAGKGDNSLQHYNLVHKFIPVPQAMKIPAAKAAVDKECEKLEKISAWNLTKVRSKKRVIDEARTSGAKVHFASLMDMSLEKCWIGGKTPEIQRSSCTPRWYCKRRFGGLMQYSLNKDHQHHKWQQQKSWYHFQIAWLRWTSSRRSICWNPCKNGRGTQNIDNSKIGMSRHVDSVYHDTNGQNHGPVWKT